MFRSFARTLYFTAILAAITLAFLAAANAQTAEQRDAIEKYAKAYNLDPILMTAIAGVESGYNNNAVGALGEQGLFQLRPEFHKGNDLGSVDGNVRAAAAYLHHLRSVCAPRMGAAYFLCFNTGEHRHPTHPEQSAYYKRVSTIYKQKLAEQRRKVTPYGQN